MNIVIEDIQTSEGIIQKIVLENDHLMKVELLTYGASIYQINIDGSDYCVSPLDIEDFMTSSLYYGKTIGRMSGRISTKTFDLNHMQVQLNPYGSNEFQLHGGRLGFSFQNFELIKSEITENLVVVTMRYLSPDLEEGYPGELVLDVTYTLDQNQMLKIDYYATSTEDTLANFTNHTYFNLLGEQNQILDHEFLIPSSSYVNRDEEYRFINVEYVDQDFDFRIMKKLKSNDQHITQTFKGIDHIFLLDENSDIHVRHQHASHQLIVSSDYPAVVFFTHNHKNSELDHRFPEDGLYSSFALECQYEPGNISKDEFEKLILKKGEPYNHYITYQFIK